MEARSIQRHTAKRLWDKKEDQLLLQIVGRQKVINWSSVTQQFNYNIAQRVSSQSPIIRTSKQCRERWQNYLNPQLHNKLPWLPEEHALLFKQFKQFSHQWSLISERLSEHGLAKRGDNSIKNYFYATIKRGIKLINGHIHDHNKIVKKRKSQLYQYQQKYPYKKRLSLQRQITEANTVWIQVNEDKFPSVESTKSEDLKIIKELDLDNVNKILEINECNGDKQTILDQSELCVDVCSLRDTIINFFQDQTTLTADQIIAMSREVLEISRKRKCKRKSQKVINFTGNSEVHLSCFTEDPIQKESDFHKKMEVEGKGLSGSKSFNEQSNQQKLLLSQQFKPPFWTPRNLIEDQPNFFQNQHEAIRSLLEQSSQLLYNSGHYDPINREGSQYNYDQIGFAQQGVDFKQFNFGESKSIDISRMMDREDACSNIAQFNFLNSIREVKPEENQIDSHQIDLDYRGFGTLYRPNSLRRHNQVDEEANSDQCRPQLISSHLYQLHRKSHSDHSFHSKKEGEQQQNGNVQLSNSRQMHRSWAYSQNRGQQRDFLFKSDDYDLNHQIPLDLKQQLPPFNDS